MDFNTIDWNAMWGEATQRSQWKNDLSQKELWDRRAASFSQRINRVMNGEERDKDDYITKMLERIEVKPGWTLLDIGCGPGTLTIPLAKIAGSVTALDISSEMMKRLKANAAKNGLDNIRYLNASWQDAFARREAGSHDVVVASRSLMSDDMKDALTYIINITGRAAYLTFPIIHLPFDWEVYRIIGREKKRHPPYIYILNMLFQMGINANVEVLRSKVRVQFANIDDAIEDLQWRTDPFSPEEQAKLREYLEKKFAEQGDPQGLTHEGKSKWALIWWRREDQA